MLSWGLALEIWLDGFVLLVELGQIWNDVLDDVGVWQWVNLGLVLGINWNTACFFVSSCLDCPSTRLYARGGGFGNKAFIAGIYLHKQARVLTPSMFMAQDPQIPSLQERRKVRVGSTSFLMRMSASNIIGPVLLRSKV